MNISTVINSILLALLLGIVGWVGTEVKKIVPSAISFLVAKVGELNANKLEKGAKQIWNAIEEDGRLGKLVNSKVDTFEALIKAKFPAITDSDIELARQAIAGEVNKDKAAVIADVETPIAEPVVKTVVITPILKYVTPDGKEVHITPVEAPVVDTAVVTPVEATIAPIENVVPTEAVVAPVADQVITPEVVATNPTGTPQ